MKYFGKDKGERLPGLRCIAAAIIASSCVAQQQSNLAGCCQMQATREATRETSRRPQLLGGAAWSARSSDNTCAAACPLKNPTAAAHRRARVWDSGATGHTFEQPVVPR